MNCQELEHYLHDHIPLSRAMQVSVVAVGPNDLTLQAPLAPNINHQETLFGGSASAIAILAGWSLIHVRLATAGIPNRLVIQRNTMHYDHPVTGACTARAFLAAPADWETFTRLLRRRNRARITALCELTGGGLVAGRLDASYVALREH